MFQAFDLSPSINLLDWILVDFPAKAQSIGLSYNQLCAFCDCGVRGERGCDGSHSRANWEGLPGCVDVEQKKTTGRFGQA